MQSRLDKLHEFGAKGAAGEFSAVSEEMGEDVGRGKIQNAQYESILEELQEELVRLQAWVRAKGLRVAVIFEGRDAAGKGGVIKRITEHLNPRVVRVVALPAPSERERKSFYFQRYVAQLPAEGEMVIFDRSWYNRGLVEKVMGFCTPEEHKLFLKQAPVFEELLIDSGLILIKYWFSVSDKEQEKRFRARLSDIKTQWKLSPMDVEAQAHWVDYAKAKDELFAATHTAKSPWYVVESDDKKRARLNCISHLLSTIPYGVIPYTPIALPERQRDDEGYLATRPPKGTNETLVPPRF